jgi:hypothetical protein
MPSLYFELHQNGTCILSIIKPFPNLLTMIPIFMNGGSVATHFIGLQSNLYYADHVIRNFPMGDPKVTYQNPLPIDMNGSVSSTLFDSIGEVSSPDVAKAALYRNNISVSCNLADKIVAIVSIRGVLLYLSPEACKNILECESKSIVGSNISDYLHPADNVHVLRTLKVASTDDISVNVNCRVKKRISGYSHVNIFGKVSKLRGMRSLILSIKPIFLSDVSLNSLMLESNDPPIFFKVSPQLLILYCSEFIFTKIGGTIVGTRIFDQFVFFEPEQRILEQIRNSDAIELDCKLKDDVVSLRFLKTSDNRGFTLLAQLIYKPSGHDKKLAYSTFTGNVYDTINNSNPFSLFCEWKTLSKKNDRMKMEISRKTTEIK